MPKKILTLETQDNQFLIRGVNKKPLPLRGKFIIDKDNELICLFSEESAYKQFGFSKQIKFRGSWKFTPEHNLVFEVKKQYKNLKFKRIVLKTGFIDCDKEGLIFTIKRKVSSHREKIELLKLRGRFSTDRFNRLIFEVNKKEPDFLVFRGAWDIDKNLQITYTYQKLKTKKKIYFRLKGYWKVSEKNKLVYILENLPGERLEFKTHLQTLNLYPQRGILKYRLGVALKQERRIRVISFYGELKFSRKGGVFLELGCGGERKIRLKISFSLSKENKLICSLYREEGNFLGLSLVFKRNTPCFNYFLRLPKSSSGRRIELGGSFKF
ncbi:MAG TPA: hypothetical protein ENI31_00470 [Candidatus Omnitrophica bacterium]|nr:MAG: hypothetical protein DRP61_05895 [Candidatus Omnitrophota bacterium]HEC68753.1 hypothetical protein [Candidatus Omnitrophota bacterium]